MSLICDAMRFAPLGSVALGGLLGEAVEANRTGRLRTFIVNETSEAIAIFARDRAQANVQGDWYGEHAGKWLLAAVKAAKRIDDAELLGRARRVADWLIDQQEADGYLGTYAPSRRFMRRQPPKPPSWDGAPAERTWDIWNHSYLVLGFLELHTATTDARYLQAARAIGDLCLNTLTKGQIAITELGNHFGLSASVLLDPAVELHLATGEQDYLDLALLIVDQIEREPGNRMFSQALDGVDPSAIATGKAYQLLWNMVGVAKLYRVTGDGRFLTATLNIWQAVRDHHLTLGGGPWGGVAHRSREVFNPVGTFDPQAYVETCSTMAWIQLNRELLRILGEARFAEEIERSAYNDLLGAQAPNGEDWCYYSFPNGKRVHTTYWRCCKSSGAVALEELSSLAYAVTKGGEIAINLLGPSTAHIDVPGVGQVCIVQTTAYPFDGEIKIAMQQSGVSVPLLIRVPEWAEGAVIKQTGTALIPGTYARIETAGDITITLPMVPRHHRREAHNVQQSLAPDGSPVEQEVMRHAYAAITRGPLVYATRLVDGYKPVETIRPAASALSMADDDVVLSLQDRSPIIFEPYFRAGGRHHGSWRLTWLRLPPEEVA